MSRKSRSRGFVPRWGHTNLTPPKPVKGNTAADVAYLNRVIKRANRAAGYDTAKKPFVWEWSLGDKSGSVEAHTRSEARCLIKKELGLTKRKDRLPVGIPITKVEVSNVG
jgi:hypothetical protein